MVGRFITRRFRALAVLSAIAASVPAVSAQTSYTGPDNGNWNTGANWSAGVPNAATPTFVNQNPGITVNINSFSADVGNFTLGIGNTININSGHLSLTGTSNTLAGTINVNNATNFYLLGNVNNTGNVNINPIGNYTYLRLNGNTTLTGGGTFTFGNATGNSFGNWSGVAGSVLTNVDNTIQGVSADGGSSIGNGVLTFINSGIFNANITGREFILSPLNGSATDTVTFTNNASGLLKATNGGILVLRNSAIYQNDGAILASGTGSVVSLRDNVRIRGSGSFQSNSGGYIEVAAGQSVFVANTTNAADLRVQNNANLYLTGTINNTGTISINPTGNNYTYLRTNGDVTLTGGGTITFNLSADNRGLGNWAGTAGNVVTNVDNLIQGVSFENGSDLGNSQLHFINSGIFDANVTGRTLAISPRNLSNSSISTFTNNVGGIIRATNGGILALGNGAIFQNDGTILANGSSGTTNSVVSLRNNIIVKGSGTLQSSGSGYVEVAAGNSVFFEGVANAADLRVQNNATLYLTGVINNSGAISINPTGNNYTYLRTNGDVTLTGGGTITFNLSADNRGLGNWAGTAGNVVTNVDNLIQGVSLEAGSDLGNGQLHFINGGIFDANVTGRTLAINPRNLSNSSISTFTNNVGGIIRATNGGILALGNGAIFQNDGTILANGSSGTSNSVVSLRNNIIVKGSGTLQSSGSGYVEVAASNSVFFEGVANAADLRVQNNATLYLTGVINNTGAISINPTANNYTYLRTNGNVTLTGGGTITFNLSADNRGLGNWAGTAGNVVTNVDNLIQGASFEEGSDLGNGQLRFINSGTFSANIAGKTLRISPQNSGTTTTFTNQAGGTMQATNGGTLSLNTASYTNSGTFEALQGSDIFMSSGAILTNNVAGVLTGGTYRVVSGGTFANQTLRGAAVTTIAANTTVELSGLNSILQFGATGLESSLNTNAGTLKILNNRNFGTSGNFANQATGTVQLGGGTFNLPSTSSTYTNQGLTTGFGTLNFRPLNTGSIVAAGGTLIVTGGIQGGSGTIQVDPGATLDISGGNSSADNLIHNGNTANSLVIGDKTLPWKSPTPTPISAVATPSISTPTSAAPPGRSLQQARTPSPSAAMRSPTTSTLATSMSAIPSQRTTTSATTAQAPKSSSRSRPA